MDIIKFIGPGLLVTVGFIDPGNWASNLAAGADYGYALLWMVTLSTIMLIILQHNVAHLGIATGLCLSEATAIHLKPLYSKTLLSSAMVASVSTSLAEILGGGIALNMLFGIPIRAAALLVTVFVLIMLFTNSYRLIEKWIIAFVSIIGLSFLYELSLVQVDWNSALYGWVTPAFPEGSMIVIMSVLGAVVMPHNLFLHSEIIQSRQWNLKEEHVIKKQLKVASTITSGMAAGTIFAGMYKEPYDIKDNHSRVGVIISLLLGLAIIFMIPNPFQGLIYSQMLLSIQLPFTIFLQVHLTSSEKVMGKFKNSVFTKYLLYLIGVVVTVLNIALFVSFFK